MVYNRYIAIHKSRLPCRITRGRECATETALGEWVMKSQPERLHLWRGKRRVLQKVAERLSDLGVVKTHADIAFELDRPGTLRTCERTMESLTGYLSAELQQVSLPFLLSPEVRALGEESLAKAGMGHVVSFDATILTKQGMRRDVVFTLVPKFHATGDIVGIVGTVREAMSLSRFDHRLTESELRYQSLFVDNVDAVLTFDREGNFVNVNPATETLMGYQANELIGRSFLPFIVESERQKTFEHYSQVLNGHTVQYETAMIDRQGGQIDLHVTVIPILFNGAVAGVHCIGKNITEQKRLQHRLEHLAYHDALTGLENRPALIKQLEGLLGDAALMSRNVAVLFLDVDRFKIVNDSLGHSAGDVLLQQLAARLAPLRRSARRIYRLGGDEFLFLLTESQRDEAVQFARQVVERFTDPFSVRDYEIQLTASIGIAVSPDHGITAEALIQHADYAMYQAKKRGRNHIHVFDLEESHRSRQALELETEMRHALVHGDFTLYFQPKIHVKTKRIVGAEALIRWSHPERGLVPPAEFIPLAEETGQIVGIGTWVLRAACAQCRAWQDEGFAPIPVSVNVSSAQFEAESFTATVEKTLAQVGLAPEYLEIEITESTTAYRTHDGDLSPPQATRSQDRD